VPAKSLKLDIKPNGLTFTGASETKKTTYHLEMDFFEEIDVENSKVHHTAANIQLVLRKKELKEEYWPRLLKDKAKVHYLRTDFDKVSLQRGSPARLPACFGPIRKHFCVSMNTDTFAVG